MRTCLVLLGVALGLTAGSALAQSLNTDQIVKYYRKKNNVPPAQAINVTGLKDSPIKGAKEGTLEIGTAPQVQEDPFTTSPDGKYVIFAEVSDVTVDPSKAVMGKIKLDGAACKGPERREGDDRRVLGLPVPLLRQGIHHARAAGAEGVRRQGEVLLQGLPAGLPSVGGAGGDRGRVRARAEGRRLLEGLRRVLPESEGHQPHQREGQGVGVRGRRDRQGEVRATASTTRRRRRA